MLIYTIIPHNLTYIQACIYTQLHACTNTDISQIHSHIHTHLCTHTYRYITTHTLCFSQITLSPENIHQQSTNHAAPEPGS